MTNLFLNLSYIASGNRILVVVFTLQITKCGHILQYKSTMTQGLLIKI